AEANLKNPDSIFYYYKKLIEIRKKYKVISHGLYERVLKNEKNLYAFERKYENEKVLVINNLSQEEFIVDLGDMKTGKQLLSNYKQSELKEKQLLRPYESMVLYKKI